MLVNPKFYFYFVNPKYNAILPKSQGDGNETPRKCDVNNLVAVLEE